MKTCTRCNETKDLASFGTQSRGAEVKSWCKACCCAVSQAWYAKNKERVKLRESQPGARKRASERTKRCALKRRYGLDEAGLQAMLEAQANGCAICGDKLRRWFDRWGEGRGPRTDAINIDHCHKSGRIRGVLCTRCNRGLGLFLDSPERLRAAALYIERHKE